jgi:hypothetical protein
MRGAHTLQAVRAATLFGEVFILGYRNVVDRSKVHFQAIPLLLYVFQCVASHQLPASFLYRSNEPPQLQRQIMNNSPTVTEKLMRMFCRSQQLPRFMPYAATTTNRTSE